RRGLPVGRRGNLELLQDVRELAPTLGQIHHMVGRTKNADAVPVEVLGQLERCLPPELHDHPDRILVLDDVEHAFPVHGLEVELIRYVEIRRYGLRIAVDHDGLVAQLAGGHDPVHAGVIELDALADSVRTAAQDDDLLPIRYDALRLRLVGGVEVRRFGRKLARARVDNLEWREDVERFPMLTNLIFRVIPIQQICYLDIRKTVSLHAIDDVSVHLRRRVLTDLILQSDHILYL